MHHPYGKCSICFTEQNVTILTNCSLTKAQTATGADTRSPHGRQRKWWWVYYIQQPSCLISQESKEKGTQNTRQEKSPKKAVLQATGAKLLHKIVTHRNSLSKRQHINCILAQTDAYHVHWAHIRFVHNGGISLLKFLMRPEAPRLKPSNLPFRSFPLSLTHSYPFKKFPCYLNYSGTNRYKAAFY